MLLVEERLEVCWTNRAAVDVLKEGSLLRLDRGRLRCPDPENQQRIELLVAAPASGCWTGDMLGEPGEPDSAVVLVRRGVDCGLTGILLRPWRQRATLVLASAKRIGLTPAERQLMAVLMEGRSVAEAAEILGKSVLTARTQLKRCYAKFGVATKEQLFAKLVEMSFYGRPS